MDNTKLGTDAASAEAEMKPVSVRTRSQALLAAFAPAATLFIFGPLETYLPNATFQTGPLAVLIYLSLIGLAATALLTAIVLLLPDRIRPALIGLLVWLGIAA